MAQPKRNSQRAPSLAAGPAAGPAATQPHPADQHPAGESSDSVQREPLRLAEAPTTPDVASRLAEDRAKLGRLERDYQHALRQSVAASERAQIAAAFRESDALQRRILATAHRVRELERELAQGSAADIRELRTAAGSDELPAAADDAA